jgi:hypothetical protein
MFGRCFKSRPTPATTIGVEIDGSEIQVIEWVLYAGWNAEHNHGLEDRDGTGPVPAFVKALHMRVGAAAAAAEATGSRPPSGVPLLEHEIDTVERAVRTLQASDMYRAHQQIKAGSALLTQLHVRLGHAVAVRELAGMPVFAAQLTAPPTLRREQG